MQNSYAQATLELIAAGSDIDTVLAGLSDTLKQANHQKLHGTILNIVLRTIEAQSAFAGPQVTVCQEADVETFAASIKAAIAQIDGTDETYQTKIDDTLIGGFVVEHNHQQIDQSYKTKLSQLYQAVTK